MAKYAEITDAVDQALTIEERHLLAADVMLESELKVLGFNPDDFSLPIPVLTQIAAFMALKLACVEQPITENQLFEKKYEHYDALITKLINGLVADRLGVADYTGNVGVYLI